MTEEKKIRISKPAFQALLGFVRAAQAAVRIVEQYQSLYIELVEKECKNTTTEWISDIVWDSDSDAGAKLIAEFEVV